MMLGVIADDYTGATDVASLQVHARMRTAQALEDARDALLSESGLGVRNIRIGPAICPGVPLTQVEGARLLLALKPGNLGGPDFFAQALAMVH